MSPDKLVYTANQIGIFFRRRPHDEAVASIAGHIRQYWDPRMRSALLAHLDGGGGGLDPLVLQAVRSLHLANPVP